MKTEKIMLPTNENVSLTTYILDSSDEMKNTFVRPAILVCPGGGYHMCSDREAEPVAMAFLAEGYNVFVLRYSIKENAAFPKPLNDAEYALELIRSNADEWHVDPNKIAVCGFSAGGHLAAALGTMGRVRPNAMILGYPCILDSISHILAAEIPSLENYVDDKTPPAFIFSTFEDSCVPIENTVKFADALTTANIPFELHIFQKGSHGLSVSKSHTGHNNKRVEQWIDLCVSWLKLNLGDYEHKVQ